MEFGFWVMEKFTFETKCGVLILVIMEFGFWDFVKLFSQVNTPKVLILVIMEFGFWEMNKELLKQMLGLNPCYNGIWFLSFRKQTK